MRWSIPGRASRSTSAATYQPALDGVRAISVIAVLVFHAGISWMTGGYLGVSVFFTLSGFLITRLLLVEHSRTGSIDAPVFYARRAKRLLPASIVCLIGVCVFAAAGAFDGVAGLRRDVVGAMLQVANWTSLAGGGSYAEQLAAEAGKRSPLTHYWSLAIEEQFYWLWPLVVGLLLRWASKRGDRDRRTLRAMATLTIVFGAAAPVIAAVWGDRAAYWATPARIAEILVGALLAVLLHAHPRLATGHNRVSPGAWAAIGTACLAAIVATFVLAPASGGFAYAGGLPLFAVLSGGLLWSLQVQHPLTAAVGVAPLAWLGRLSYGVYLYHWPVYVLLDERRTGIDDVAPLLALRVAVTMAVAVVSYYLVEQPIRHGSLRKLRVAQFALAGTAAVLLAAVVFVPTTDDDYFAAATTPVQTLAPGETLAPLVPVTSAVQSATSTVAPTTTAPAPGDPGATPAPSTAPATVAPITGPPTTPVPARPVRILVVGDSTAEATATGLIAWADAHPELATVSLAVKRGCGFLPGGEIWSDDGWRQVSADCDGWLEEEIPAAVDAVQPDVAMLMTTSWDVLDRRWPDSGTLTPADQGYRDRLWFAMQAVTDGLLDHGVAHVVWVEHPIAYPLWLYDTTQSEPDRHVPLYEGMQRLAAADPARVTVADLQGWVQQRGWVDDHEARPDGTHWSPEAATEIATDFLGPALVAAALRA